MRGQHRDYDEWDGEHGCIGWAYKDVLPTFKRQEKNTRLADDFHGTCGKLIVDDPATPHPVSKMVIEAAVAAGIPRTNDFNGARQEGAGWYQVTASDGQRHSAATCFLRPELNRENLTVLTNFQAQRIRIQNRCATAIEAKDQTGQDIVIKARGEIILCAGSFHSPKLLMLSGIGPRDELDRHGIDIIHEANEVGRNYQDHVGAPVTRRLEGVKGLYGADRGLAAIKNGINYFGFKRGLLMSNLLQAGACVDTDGAGRPDVQYNFAPFAPGAPGAPPLPFHAVQVHPMTMRPKSGGRLGLTSKDAASAPKFLSNALGHIDDLETLRRGVCLARRIFEQMGLKDKVGTEIWPGADIDSRVGSNNLDDAIREHARTIFHPAGTCSMGPMPSSVVDLELRVNGIEGLRVADCSIMPALVSGNTNAPTMMIADRAADFLLG